MIKSPSAFFGVVFFLAGTTLLLALPMEVNLSQGEEGKSGAAFSTPSLIRERTAEQNSIQLARGGDVSIQETEQPAEQSMTDEGRKDILPREEAEQIKKTSRDFRRVTIQNERKIAEAEAAIESYHELEETEARVDAVIANYARKSQNKIGTLTNFDSTAVRIEELKLEEQETALEADQKGIAEEQENLFQKIEIVFQLAEQASKEAQIAWDKAMLLSEADFQFWTVWENAIEAANEAYQIWEDVYNLRQDKTLGQSKFNFQRAEEQKNFWLEQLKTAKVEPPLKWGEDENSNVAPASHAALFLPEFIKMDPVRLGLRRELDQLLAQKEDSKSSLFLETRPRCSSSNASDFAPTAIHIDLDKKISDLQQQWRDKTQEAEAQRNNELRNQGKEEQPFSTMKALFAWWKVNDQAILKAQHEEQARLEKEERTKRLAATWERDTHRWNARARADGLWEKVNDMDHAYRFHNRASNFEDEEWEKENQKLIQQLDYLKEKLHQARQEWEQKAEKHPDVLTASAQGKEAFEEAKNQLKKSDRVIVDLLKDFNDHVYQGIFFPSDPPTPASAEQIARCKAALLEQKEAALADQHFTLEKYIKLVTRQALKEAKDKIPGEREAWESLVQKSEEEAKNYKATHGENEESRRLDAIAEADRAGYRTLLNEMKYHDDIQKSWFDRLEELAMRRVAAAEAYFKGDTFLWTKLTSAERAYYNVPIRKAQEAAATKVREEAEERVRWAREEEERVQQSFLVSNAEKAKRKQEREEAYRNLKQNLRNEVRIKEEACRAAYQEVEHIHDPKNQGWLFGPSSNQKQKTIDALIAASSSLLDLHTQLNQQDRKQEYENGSLPLDQQEAREVSLAAMEQADKEEYLQWLGLTPQEKEKQIKQAVRYASLAWFDSEKSLKKIIEAECLGKIKEAMLRNKSAICYKQVREAEIQVAGPAILLNEDGLLINRADQAGAALQKKIAVALEGRGSGAAFYHNQAAEEEKKGNRKATELYIQAGRAREAQAAALHEGDQARAALQEKIAEALGGPHSATYYYTRAAEEEKKENNKIAELYIQAGRAREAQAAALNEGNQARAASQQKIAEALDAWNGPVSYYTRAAEEEKKGNHKATKLYIQAGRAREAQVSALHEGDQSRAALQEKIAEALDGPHGATYYYTRAAEEEKKENNKIAELYIQAGRACEAQVAALNEGDQARAALQEKIIEALYHWNGPVSYYRRAAEEEKKGNHKATELYIQAGRACEAQVAALTQQAAALAIGDQARAALHEEIMEVLSGAIYYYNEAAKEEKQGNQQATELYIQAGRVREAQVAALNEGDQVRAALQEKIAVTLGAWNGAAYYTSKLVENEKKEIKKKLHFGDRKLKQKKMKQFGFK